MDYSRRAERMRRQASSESRAVSSGQVWPPDWSVVTDPRTLSRQVWDETTALSVPAVAKALHIYQLIGVMPLRRFRGVKPLASTRLLDQPDLSSAGSTWFVSQSLSDWVLSGNAVHMVTARDAESLPAAVRYYPARCWHADFYTDGSVKDYYLNGKRVPFDDVVHVRRGQRPGAHGMGWGIVEQHLATLDRAGLESEAERQNLKGGGVPSVAVIAPQKDLTQANADAVADSWTTKMAGPGRQPAILPNGTQVIPLGWSASDSEMVEARKMTLIDVGNLTNIDSYFLGAQPGSHNYKSPGPLWLQLLRMSLEYPARLFEDAWSQAWLPPGQRVVFDRLALVRDDLQTSIATIAAARKARLMTYREGREYLGWDPDVQEPEAVAAPPVAAPAGQEQEDPAVAPGEGDANADQ